MGLCEHGHNWFEKFLRHQKTGRQDSHLGHCKGSRGGTEVGQPGLCGIVEGREGMMPHVSSSCMRSIVQEAGGV